MAESARGPRAGPIGPALARAKREGVEEQQRKVVAISEDKFNDICRRLFDGSLQGAEAARELQSARDQGTKLVQLPELGDEVKVSQVLQASQDLEFSPGEKGRISRDRYMDDDGDECIEVTWYRSGKISAITVGECWQILRTIGKAYWPRQGDEVEALATQSFKGQSGNVYFMGGDKGRVSQEYKDDEGMDYIKITWYTSGLTSRHRLLEWMQVCKVVEEDSVDLIGASEKKRMEDAIGDTNVPPSKPAEFITGQPRFAALGVYHRMRVNDPFAEEGAQNIKSEVEAFVKNIQHEAVLCDFLDDSPDELERIEAVFGSNMVQEAREDIKYFRGVARLDDKDRGLAVAKKIKQEVEENLDYVMNQPTSEKYVEGPNAIRDKGRGEVRLRDFLEDEHAKRAELSDAHVIALRFYTTPAFKYLNSPLRNTQDYYNKHKRHPMPLTVAYISEGIKKLRAAYAIELEDCEEKKATLTLWRGLKDMRLPDGFLKNQKGGTEFAPLSTTTDIAVAAKYAFSANSILLKISLNNFLEYGADLRWLSAFPGEAEVLYPPLTYLQPTTREPQEVQLQGGIKFIVYEVKPTIP